MALSWFRGGISKTEARVAQRASGSLTPQELAARIAAADAAGLRGDFEDARLMFAQINALQPGNPQVLMQLGICNAELGELPAAREALTASIQIDPRNQRAHKKLAGALLELRDFPEALSTALAAGELDHSDSEPLVLAASASLGSGHFDEAANYLNLAWERSPESALVFYLLEVLANDMIVRSELLERHEGMPAARRRVVNRLKAACRKKSIGAIELTYLIAILSGSREYFPEAARIAAESVSFEPMYNELASQIASVLYLVGDPVRNLAFARASFEREPDNLSRKYALGSAWISAGSDQWAAGWRLMTESYYVARPFVHPLSVPIWEGQKLGKKKLFVYQDQGLGDAILGFRFLRELVARKIRFDLWVHPNLVDLADQIPGPETVHRTQTVVFPDQSEVAYAVSFFGLISALHLDLEEIRRPPVIRPAASHAGALRDRMRALGGLRIGLLFGGNPRRRDDWMRSLPIEQVRRLGGIEGIRWVNLMIDESPARSQAIEFLGIDDPMPQVQSFSDTAAIIEELDAVVAVDASVAHLAANLGKPLWVLLPAQCDWRWRIGAELSPWWPMARAYRSETPGDWSKPMDALLADLRRYVLEHSAQSVA